MATVCLVATILIAYTRKNISGVFDWDQPQEAVDLPNMVARVM